MINIKYFIHRKSQTFHNCSEALGRSKLSLIFRGISKSTKQTKEAAYGCKSFGIIQFDSIQFNGLYAEYPPNAGHCGGFLFHRKGVCLFLGTVTTQMVFTEMVRAGSEQEHK